MSNFVLRERWKATLCATLLAVFLAATAFSAPAAQDPKQEPTPPAPKLEQPQTPPEPKPQQRGAEREKTGKEGDKNKEAKAKPATPAVKRNPESGAIVEEIIARVNNEIITRSEYEKSLAQTEEETRQDCQGKCTPEQL